jgi:predicted RND superfamily exporter protein
MARISMNMADIGTTNMELLMNRLTPKIYSVLDTSKYKITITGSSVTVLDGNKYIIRGLLNSLLLAFLLIALCMGYLFRSWRMIIFSLIPNLIPLILTGGIMGFFHIPLKPSTVLIFSIAFGIAIDNAIRFLAKYQQELHRHNWDVSKTVSVAMYEAGISIIYTSIILFFGFIIFTLSHFGGTFYLGLLTSITLVVAMFNNLILLPSILLSLKSWVDRKTLNITTPADEIDMLEEDELFKEQELMTDNEH